MKLYLYVLATVVTAFVTTPNAYAQLRVANIFSDHAVLQRDASVPVWGFGNVGDQVTVSFAGQTHRTLVDDSGRWLATLQPMAANSTGQDLVIRCGDAALTCRDVLVGEVWHASGQSNMAMTVGAMSRSLEAVGSHIDNANLPAIRFCRLNGTPKPLLDLRTKANWTVCTTATASQFSGVAFYFARKLHAELGAPIGVIDSSRGGTPIEPFIPGEAFAGHPTLIQERTLGDAEDLQGIWKLPGGVRARDAHWLPGRLFNTRLAPISVYAVRGALWYQGESNCGVQEDPRDYQHKMRALINGWRTAFGNDKMPVYFVQLPGSGAREGWEYLREQQRLAADMPFTGMVTTVDIDGDDIHPPNKIDVGHRLARWALAKDYGKAVPFSGPMYSHQTIDGNNIIIHFDYADTGLMLAEKAGLTPPKKTPGAKITQLEITGADGKWRTADARIVGKTIVATSPEVSVPIAVRYAYQVKPQPCNLYNQAGLPASPFCSKSELLKFDPMLPR